MYLRVPILNRKVSIEPSAKPRLEFCCNDKKHPDSFACLFVSSFHAVCLPFSLSYSLFKADPEQQSSCRMSSEGSFKAPQVQIQALHLGRSESGAPASTTVVAKWNLAFSAIQLFLLSCSLSSIRTTACSLHIPCFSDFKRRHVPSLRY